MSEIKLSPALERALDELTLFNALDKLKEERVEKHYKSFNYKIEEFDVRGTIIYQAYFNSFEDLVEFYYKEITTNRIERCRIINQRENLILSDVSRFITLERLETIKGE